MKHPGEKPRWVKDKCGPFYVLYRERESHRYRKEGETFIDWWLCPDDEDKCHERAIATNEDDNNASTVEEAMKQVAACVVALANDMIAWTIATS